MRLMDLMKAPMRTDLPIGTTILLPMELFADADMHGKGLQYVAQELTAAGVRIENIITFETPNASGIMNAATKGSDYCYTNKFLVTVGPPQPCYDGSTYWYFVPIGYAYDGHRVGFGRLVLAGE